MLAFTDEWIAGLQAIEADDSQILDLRNMRASALYGKGRLRELLQFLEIHGDAMEREWADTPLFAAAAGLLRVAAHARLGQKQAATVVLRELITRWGGPTAFMKLPKAHSRITKLSKLGLDEHLRELGLSAALADGPHE